ncbi:MAG: type II toxin-antitoxin system death-on-curing family toxin [Patescibacteria group bacterium]
MHYLTVEEALALHAIAVRQSGGSAGVREVGTLTGCLERPKAAFGGKDMYATMWEKASVYLDSIARNHPFIDGNKRTAFLCAVAFIHKNGYEPALSDRDIVDGVLWVVTKKPPIGEIATWLEKHCVRNDL